MPLRAVRTVSRSPWNNLRKTLLVHQASEGLFDNDTGALSAFLDRLSDTVSARNTSGFREQVAAWLEKLSASAGPFQTMLAEKLQLSTAVKEIAFLWRVGSDSK
ncbi:hypothetical protein Asd1617_06287 (plasmid) [Shigella dysenteriae 1617]|uniref:NEL domain-containing protein n=1 Tax=Shigella dysenteriae 1617 TaxID=754093 RepID=A0A0A7A4V6_SHIDY|nr:hypothetical protein Asd1617_06287 [Shigella dysenteriae 1617]